MWGGQKSPEENQQTTLRLLNTNAIYDNKLYKQHLLIAQVRGDFYTFEIIICEVEGWIFSLPHTGVIYLNKYLKWLSLRPLILIEIRWVCGSSEQDYN